MLRRSQTAAAQSQATPQSTTNPRPPTSGALLSAAQPNTVANQQPSSKAHHPFFLPSTDFFVGEQDSLLLSESDIFQSAASVAQRQLAKENENPRRGRPTIAPNPSHRTIAALQPATTGLKRAADKVLLAPQPPKMPHLTPKLAGPEASSLFYAAVNKASPSPHRPASAAFYGAVDGSSGHLLDKDNKHPTDKGLRHFSAKVSAKVEEKGCTTYNEVADELVREFDFDLEKCDHKNIRRRVYDALNVLMAIDIIQKDKKEIRWLGLPNQTVDDLRALEAEKAAIQQRIAEKTRGLREVLRRCISLKNLIDRNAEMERTRLDPSSSSNDRLNLPFILISASRDCHVHCEMLEDRTQYFFEFNTAFQINEDTEVMRLLGLDTARVEQIKSFFPRELISHVLLLCLSSSTAPAHPSLLPSFSNGTPGGSVFAPLGVDPLHLSSLPPSSPM